VREILDLQPLSPLPNAPRDLLGMIDVRGEGLAVLDLADRLGFAARGADAGDARILVLERAGQAPVGVIADRVRDVLEIPPDQVDPPPAIPGGWRPDAVHGVARLDGRIAYVLDLDAILAPNDAAFDFG
jgi:purine-binding chemotaxis protein CheW